MPSVTFVLKEPLHTKFASLPNKKPRSVKLSGPFVPETGFEPAHPFGRHHLKVVRLPISPPGLFGYWLTG